MFLPNGDHPHPPPLLQVLWSYGTRSNDDYFVYHGFALPDNPDEDVVLFGDVQQLVDWAEQHMPQLRALKADTANARQRAAAAGIEANHHANL